MTAEGRTVAVSKRTEAELLLKVRMVLRWPTTCCDAVQVWVMLNLLLLVEMLLTPSRLSSEAVVRSHWGRDVTRWEAVREVLVLMERRWLLLWRRFLMLRWHRRRVLDGHRRYLWSGQRGRSNQEQLGVATRSLNIIVQWMILGLLIRAHHEFSGKVALLVPILHERSRKGSLYLSRWVAVPPSLVVCRPWSRRWRWRCGRR